MSGRVRPGRLSVKTCSVGLLSVVTCSAKSASCRDLFNGVGFVSVRVR